MEQMTNSAFEKVKKFIRESIKEKALKDGLQVLDYYKDTEESPIYDFVKSYNETAKGKSIIDYDCEENRCKLIDWWCWFEGEGIDKLRNQIKKETV